MDECCANAFLRPTDQPAFTGMAVMQAAAHLKGERCFGVGATSLAIDVGLVHPLSCDTAFIAFYRAAPGTDGAGIWSIEKAWSACLLFCVTHAVLHHARQQTMQAFAAKPSCARSTWESVWAPWPGR